MRTKAYRHGDLLPPVAPSPDAGTGPADTTAVDQAAEAADCGPALCGLDRLCPHGSKRLSHSRAEVGDKAGHVRFRPLEVVVGRSDRQRSVVAGQVLSVVLFQTANPL